MAESYSYPRLTLLGQAVGSFLVAFEAAFRAWQSRVIVDTIGYPFTYPVLKLFRFQILAYVHYPFIHLDFLHGNQKGKNMSLFTRLKNQYYSLIIFFYGLTGDHVNVALCNSTWTLNHIKQLWRKCPQTAILYPPCDLEPFLQVPRSPEGFKVLSLGQFRPEKNHLLQLEIAKRVITKIPEAQFVFVGGCRNESDWQRVRDLQKRAAALGIQDSVQFQVNLPFPKLLETLSTASVGLHTMTEEHFGIGIVELMAAGLITIAHNSGGPRADIIRPGCN